MFMTCYLWVLTLHSCLLRTFASKYTSLFGSFWTLYVCCTITVMLLFMCALRMHMYGGCNLLYGECDEGF